MNLHTARLRIRDLTPADAEGLFAIYGNAEVRRFIGGAPTPNLAEQRVQLAATLERQASELPGYGRWGVERLADGVLVGVALLKNPPDGEGRPLPEVEVGWHLGHFAWGNGYATEAGRALLDHARDDLRLRTVYAVVNPDNARSIRVTERLGMEPLGLTNRFYGKAVLHFVWRDADGVE